MNFLESIRKFFKKLWFIIWKDNSLKGWILSLVIIFIFIKFIFFPILSVATGTSLPLAIVESCSMYHSNDIFSNFNLWYQRHEIKYSSLNISEQQFSKFSLTNGFSKGDILFVTGVKPQNIKIGDVIIFNSLVQSTPVIHRVINITYENGTYFFSTEGDNNNGQLQEPYSNVDETHINQNQIIGKANFILVPYIGWIKLVFYESQNPDKGFCTETPSA